MDLVVLFVLLVGAVALTKKPKRPQGHEEDHIYLPFGKRASAAIGAEKVRNHERSRGLLRKRGFPFIGAEQDGNFDSPKNNFFMMDGFPFYIVPVPIKNSDIDTSDKPPLSDEESYWWYALFPFLRYGKRDLPDIGAEQERNDRLPFLGTIIWNGTDLHYIPPPHKHSSDSAKGREGHRGHVYLPFGKRASAAIGAEKVKNYERTRGLLRKRGFPFIEADQDGNFNSPKNNFFMMDGFPFYIVPVPIKNSVIDTSDNPPLSDEESYWWYALFPFLRYGKRDLPAIDN